MTLTDDEYLARMEAANASLRARNAAWLEAINHIKVPAVHEAVSTVSGEGLVPGTVAQVVRPGYGSDDKILRPAAVVVATRSP